MASVPYTSSSQGAGTETSNGKAPLDQIWRTKRRIVSRHPTLGGWSSPPCTTAIRGCPLMKRSSICSRTTDTPASRKASSTIGVITVTGWGRLISGSLNLFECILIAEKALPETPRVLNCAHKNWAHYTIPCGDGSTLNVQYHPHFCRFGDRANRH